MTILEKIIHYGMFFLPSLISTLTFAIWLPRQIRKWEEKLLSSALIASTVFILSLLYFNIKTMQVYIFSIIIILFIDLLVVSPLVVGVYALLYYGGKAIHLHLSTSRVVFGYIRVILGFLLLTVAQLLYVFLEIIICAAFGYDITG